MGTMTAKQLTAVARIFTDGDVPSEQVQTILDSGLLADLRDADVRQIDRSAFRKLCGLSPVAALKGSILTLDRTWPFDPAQFLGAGWSIWRGPANGDGLEGEEDQDQRALALQSLDLAKIRLETCLLSGETSIGGESKQKVLKAMQVIRLDAVVFRTLWENQNLIPEEWKKTTNGNTTYIFFDGTVLRCPIGGRCVLYLYRRGSGWDWRYDWLSDGWFADDPSAVLAIEHLVT